MHMFFLETTNLLESLLPGELNEMKAIISAWGMLCCSHCQWMDNKDAALLVDICMGYWISLDLICFLSGNTEVYC